VARLILRKDAQEACLGKEDADYDDLVRTIFSAKESVFKAVFAQVKRFIEFDEIRLVFGPEEQSFKAIAPDNEWLNEIVAAGNGKYLYFQNLVVTSFFLPVSTLS
jgi:4'-phosphopantetheinyl transferase EntD